MPKKMKPKKRKSKKRNLKKMNLKKKKLKKLKNNDKLKIVKFYKYLRQEEFYNYY